MFTISSQRGFLFKVLICPLKIKKKKKDQPKQELPFSQTWAVFSHIHVMFGLRNLPRRFFTVWTTREVLKLSKRYTIIHHPNMKISSQSSHSEQHTCPWRQAWVKKQMIRKALMGGAYGGFPGGSDGRESACNSGDLSSVPESGRSPGEGNATHSSILAWRIPWTGEPGGVQSVGSQRVRCDWAQMKQLTLPL